MICRRVSLASLERRPCRQLARRDLARPKGVLGPVDSPPWNLQRPLGRGGLPQGRP